MFVFFISLVCFVQTKGTGGSDPGKCCGFGVSEDNITYPTNQRSNTLLLIKHTHPSTT